MPDRIKTINTQELFELLGRPDTVLVDARRPDAYNGWRLKAEKRGGHVSGARNLWAGWTGAEYWKDILAGKEIDRKSRIVIYGYDDEETQGVAEALIEEGYDDILIYEGFLKEWSANPGLPMEHLPRFRHLVHPEWLSKLLKGESPEEHDGTRFVVCHAHYRNPDDYALGHIENAIPLDTLELEERHLWNRRTPQELRNSLEKNGITHDTTVITYGRFSDPDKRDPFPGSNAGQIAAIRCAVIMMYAGVRDVRVLNGGLMSWIASGFDISTDTLTPERVNDFGADIPGRPGIMVGIPEAKELLASREGELVSVRSWKEFIGEVSGYNYIDVKGRIPGAIFGDCGSDAYHMENFRNPDHTTREYGEIERNWIKSGITRDKRIAFYCGTGWRASEAFLNAYLLGWNDIAVFDGGWMEWSNDPSNPIEVGIPE